MCKTRPAGEPRLPRCDPPFQLKGVFPPCFAPLSRTGISISPVASVAPMAAPAGSLFEAVTQRMDKLEQMMTLIMAKLGLQDGLSAAEAPSQNQHDARSGGLPPTKLKQKTKSNSPTKVDAPQEDSVPLPPFGWKTVTRKARKVEQVKSEEKKVPLKLVDKDWDVKILSREEIKPGVEGVLLTSDEQANDLVPTLQKQNLKLVLVTPSKYNESSVQFQCRVIAVNDRITKVQRWYTNIGLVSTAPIYVAAGTDTPKFSITNTTVKIVLQLVKKYTSSKEWSMATGNPGAALRDWINEAGVSSSVVHTFRPVHKDQLKGGAQWIEQVVIMKSDGARKLMTESGHKGIFAKRFLGQDQPPPTSDWRIVWLGQEIALKTALDRGELLGLDYKGLAHGRNGLGVRVPSSAYRSCGEKLLGDSFVPAQDSSYIYEISKVPVWISAGDLIPELTAQMAWVTDFIRVNRAYGQEKSFLVRANIPPPKDCFIVGDNLILIQPAKPKQSTAYSVSYFAGKVTNGGAKESGHTSKLGKSMTVKEDQSEIVPEVKRRKSFN